MSDILLQNAMVLNIDPDGQRASVLRGHDVLIGGLDGDTRMVLYTAAILGRHLNEPGMYALADLTASQMMHGLGRLTDLRILRDGGTGLEFANDLVRGQAYISVPLSLRRVPSGLPHGFRADVGRNSKVTWLKR